MPGLPATVTVLAAGTIGLSWTAHLAARGVQVFVNSRNPAVAEVVENAMRLYAPAIPGAEPAAMLERVTIEHDLERSVAATAAVIENGPENLDVKQHLFARIEATAQPDTLLLSSTSSFAPADIGARMKQPSRVIVGHPFNPPHVIPLVEVVCDEATSPELADRAMDFYRELGKVPIRLHRPILGFAANRLQSALLREAIYLVSEGVVTMEELDTVVTASIGLRWAAAGPFRVFHMGGGPGGLRHWLGHLGISLDSNWAQLGQPTMDPATLELLLRQADEAFAGMSFDDLAAERDRKLNAILAVLNSPAGR
jgi:ketoreductase RED1